MSVVRRHPPHCRASVPQPTISSSEKKKAISVAAVSRESEFKRVFNLGGDFATDGSQVDHLFGDG